MNAEPVIVGGGPAGAATAALLAREGLAPLLIERSTAPHHKICGEFVSIEAQAYLAELGIDPLALGGAPIRRVRIVSGEHSVESPLPFTGLGLTRRAMDEALLARASRVGARLLRGAVVREVVTERGRLLVRLRSGEELVAGTVFLASGKHDLHAPRRPSADNSDLIGFKTYFALTPAQAAGLADAVEIVLFPGGYAGLQPVEGGMANLCLLARTGLFEASGKHWDGLLDRLRALSPHLDARLRGARALLDKPLSISQVPYGFVHRPRRGDPEGLFRLGDQMGVIPSFSGDGIAIALHSARLAAAGFLAQGNAAGAYHRRMGADLGGQIRLAKLLYDASQSALPRRALLAALKLFPGLIGMLAEWTRIPAARVSAG